MSALSKERLDEWKRQAIAARKTPGPYWWPDRVLELIAEVDRLRTPAQTAADSRGEGR